MASLTGHLVSETYKALLKMIDNDILTAAEKQISDGLGGGTNVFIDQNGFLRAKKYKVTGATSSQFLKGDGSLDSTAYLPVGTTTTGVPEGINLYFTELRVLDTILTGFVSTEGTVTDEDSVLTAINKIWWNIENGGGGGGGYVPYTGAINNLNLGTFGLISDYVQFNTTNTSIPTTAGTMAWNDADGTADLRLKGGNVTLQIGQEEVLRVVNKSGASLAEADFRAVRIRSVSEGGAQGQRLAVVLAQGDNDHDSATTIGIVTETIANNQEGFITTSGEVKKINTTGAKSYGALETWVDGDILYLSPTHAGYLTNVKPQAPQHTIIIGWVVYSHAVNGKIYVKVDNGYELDELHNVKITDPQNDDFLMYDSAQSLWKNKDLHGIEGYLPYYGVSNVFEQSPIFTDASQVIIGSDTEFATGNKLSVVGNLAVDGAYGYHLGTYQILYRYNATGEFRIGTNAANDFTTFFANGIERMRLNASGYLGIGLTSPTQPLHVKGVLAYPKIIIDNNSTSGGGMFSAYQNGTETALFGISGAWLSDSSSDVAIVATRAGKGIQFYTNGSTSEKMGINSDGNVFVGQTPTYVAGATQLVVRGKTGAGYLGVNHYDMSIKGSINTFNSVFQVGTSTFHSVAILVEDIERARFNSSGRMLLGTTTDNTVDMLQVDGSIISSAIKKSGGTSSQYLMADGSVSTGPSLAGYVPTSRTLTINGTGYDLSADRSWSVGTVTSVDASVPTGFAISGNPITSSGTLAITFASGYSLPTTIKQSNWDDAYTWVSAFPTQTGNAGKFLTTNGSTLSWENVVLGVTSFNTRTGAITLLSADVTGALGYTPVTNARTLTINGTSYDLTADRAWTISAGSNARNVSTFTATSGQTTFTISGGYTANLVDVYVNGARLNANDYVATSGTDVVLNVGVVLNDIVEIVNYIASASASISGSGTSGYITKWTGTSVVNSSVLYDDGTNIGLGTITPSAKLHIVGTALVSSSMTANSFVKSGGTSAQILAADGSVITAGTNITISGGTISASGGGSITGSGTTNYITKWTGSSAIGNSIIFDNGTNVGIGTASPSQKLDITGSDVNRIVLRVANTNVSNGDKEINMFVGGQTAFGITSWQNSGVIESVAGLSSNFVLSNYQTGSIIFANSGRLERMRITSGGTIAIGNPGNGTGYGIEINTNAGQPRFDLVENATYTGAVKSYNLALWLLNNSANPVIIGTNGTEKMRILADGKVAIGNTSAPASSQFSVTTQNAGGVIGLFFDSPANTNFYWYAYSTALMIESRTGDFGSYRNIIIQPNGGNIGIRMGTTMPSYTLQVNGSIAGVGGYVNWSDARLKKDVKPLVNSLKNILNLNGITYNWDKKSNTSINFDDDNHIGLLAQDVEKILPQVVSTTKDEFGTKAIAYSDLVPVLIEAIKELNAKIESLEAK